MHRVIKGRRAIVNPTRAEARWYRILAEWNIASQDARMAILESIKENPGWGIEAIANGIQFRPSRVTDPDDLIPFGTVIH